ncbi:hypothetical protein LguiB_030966 [Lonicera macranthoides]
MLLSNQAPKETVGIFTNDDMDPVPPSCLAFELNSSLLEFVSSQSNGPRLSVHPSRIVMSSGLSQTSGCMNPSY